MFIFGIILVLIIPSSWSISINKTTSDFIEQYGYVAESFDITTEDGYGLTIFYMPPAKHCSVTKDPVLIQHGHMSCSDFAVLVGPTDSIGFILADDCHPVYLGNTRSNLYSQRHVNLSIFSPEFWKFSVDEIGRYDISAMLRLIQEQHADRPIHYVGHSQGCLEVLILLSQRPEYRSVLGTVILLAPAAYLHGARSPALQIIGLNYGCHPEVPRNYNYMERNVADSVIAQAFCSTYGEVCNIYANIAAGWSNEINQTALPDVYINQPAGNSGNEAKHLLQGYCNKIYDFKQFNYGTFRNLAKYGSINPPPYDLSKVENKFIVFYGEKDTLVIPENVERLLLDLPNVESILVKGSNHLDVVYGIYVREKVNLKVRKFLE